MNVKTTVTGRDDATAETRTIAVPVPGSRHALVYERTADGRLLTLSGNGLLYVDATSAQRIDYGQGFAIAEQTELPGGLIRRVTTRRGRWTEAYRWDTRGRLVEIDGVRMRYDDQERIVACLGGAAGDWVYGYSGDHLTVIDTPHGTRHIVRGADGRAVATREADRRTEIRYDADGHRLPRRTWPLSWNLDSTGRLWTVTDADGRVVLTLLWDSRHCLGAIAGEPGAPLAAVYSLDPTGTPVRLITGDGVHVLPRDAFGESLLDAPCPDGIIVPGLYGGAIDRGFVHLQYRRLDPRSGSFDSPDPMDGEKQDPRRLAGWTGPLAIELPAAGPYTVCRNNPVSLADPTGAISDTWWLIPSALTWSIQNTIGSLLGMWLNLEFSPLGWIISAAVKADPFDAEWISANNYHAFGLRADGWLSRIQPVAWTYQFLVNEEKEAFTALEDARLFSPDAAFRPTLYGTVLRCVPADDDAFVLRGQRTTPNGTMVVDWSRCGGTAEPALPGSRFPVFPDGGLHFNTVQRGVKQQAADLIEIEPAGFVMVGTTGTFTTLSVPATGTGLAVDGSIMLSDAAGVADVTALVEVTEGSGVTLLRVDSALARLGAGDLRLEGLTASAGTEPLTPIPGRDRLLNVAGSSLDYAPTLSVVRLSRAGVAVHAARVEGLEARLTLDQAVPAGVGVNASVRLAVASGSFNGTLSATPTVFVVPSGLRPDAGTGVLVGSGAAAIPAIVVAVDGGNVTVDRDLSALGPGGTAITYQLVAPAAEIGVRADAPETDARITYASASPGVAPDSGLVWIQGAVNAIRRVTGRPYDAIVLSQPRPDTDTAPYDVDRFRLAPPDISGVTRTQAESITLSTALTTAVALHVVQFPGGAVAPDTVIVGNAVLTGTNATTTVALASPPVGLRPSEVVVLVPSTGAPQVGLIRRLRLTVTLERALPLAEGTENIEASLMALDTLAYPAERIDGRVLRVRPMNGTTRIDMPRFVPGDLVAAQWGSGSTAGRRFFRVESVAGTTITCADDEDEIPPATTGITVTRLVLSDPGTGTARLGRDGLRISDTEIQFSVWDAADFAARFILAVIDGPTVYAVRVGDVAQPLTIELALADAISGSVDIASVPAGLSTFATDFTVAGSTVTLNNTVAAAIAAGVAAVVPYIDTASRVAGELHAGSVRIPDDHENASIELTRRQSLEDHELAHTIQSARYGPLMLVAFPLWVFELITDLTAAGGPAFSPYVSATLERGKLTILATGVTFEVNDRIQIAQNRRSIFIQLGPTAPANTKVFSLLDAAVSALSSAGYLDGLVQVRRPLGGAGSGFLEWFTNINQLLTIGGLLNVLSVAGWGGVAAIITQVVKAIRTAARSRVTVPIAADHVTLTLGADQNLDDLVEGARLAVKSGDQIFIRSVDTIVDRTITLGQAVPLSGTVEISIYSPGAALFGLRKYFPAALPDVNRPARLELTSIGSDRLELNVHDRIEIRSATGTSFRTLVTVVDGTTIEIEQPVLSRASDPNEFLVGKIAEEDPTGWVDQWMLNEMNVGWMQYFHDPWGQILYRGQPARDGSHASNAAQVFARSARYLFGTQSWMCIFLGWFWNDNAYQRANPHRSGMEQEASRASGDTYCPLGSFHGDLDVIGDVARYWITCSGGTRDGYKDDDGDGFETVNGNPYTDDTPADMLAFASTQDAAGVNLAQVPTLTVPAGTTFAVPGDFYNVDAGGAFTAIGPRGWIPAGSRLERSSGIYVAFSRPSGTPYRVTGQAGGAVDPDHITNSLDAQADEAAVLFFDRSPADVGVAAAGIPIAEDSTFEVIPFQRVPFSVTPNGARVYRATVAGQGTTLEADGTAVTAGSALLTEDVEISRFHRFDPDAGAFDSGIGPIHLPADIDIAVRRFQIAIQDRLPFRAVIDHTAEAAASIRAGEIGFVLVPAPIAPVAAPVQATVTGTPPLVPTFDTPTEPAPDNVQAFLGDGGIVRVTLPANQPPEQQETLTITIAVGPDSGSAVAVSSEVVVEPHFTLEAGGPFQVARGASIELRASDGTALAAGPAIANVTLTPAGDRVTVAVDAGFGPNSVTVLVSDAANAERMARRTLTIV